MKRSVLIASYVIIILIGVVLTFIYYLESDRAELEQEDLIERKKDPGIIIEEGGSTGVSGEPNVKNVTATVEFGNDDPLYLNYLNLPNPFDGVYKDILVESVVLARPKSYFEVNTNLYDSFREDISSKHLSLFLNDSHFTTGGGTKVNYESRINFSEVFYLNKFSDDDYNDGENITGFNISSGSKILDYIIDFEEDFEIDEFHESFIIIFGREYFVIDKGDIDNNKIFLENPYSFRIWEGENISGKYPGINLTNFSIEFFGEESIKLKVNNETTMLLGSNSYHEFENLYVYIDEVLFSTNLGVGASLVISPKELIIHDNYIEYEEKAVKEIEFIFVEDGTEYDYLIMTWTTDDELFLTPDRNVFIPFFENLEFAMTDIYRNPSNDKYSNVSLNVFSHKITQI